MSQVGQRDSYFRLDYMPQDGATAVQVPTGGIDFHQLAINKNYSKQTLALKTEDQEGHIALEGVTDKKLVHLIKASEKQTSWVTRGGWWNIFFGLPALFLGISRYFELRNTTGKILRAALDGQCDPKDLDKLLRVSGGDNQLAKFLALALTNNQPCLTKEVAATIVSNWANNRLLNEGLADHGYDQGVLQALLPPPAAGKDSPGLAKLREVITNLPAPAVLNAPPPPGRRATPQPTVQPAEPRLKIAAVVKKNWLKSAS